MHARPGTCPARPASRASRRSARTDGAGSSRARCSRPAGARGTRPRTRSRRGCTTGVYSSKPPAASRTATRLRVGHALEHLDLDAVASPRPPSRVGQRPRHVEQVVARHPDAAPRRRSRRRAAGRAAACSWRRPRPSSAYGACGQPRSSASTCSMARLAPFTMRTLIGRAGCVDAEPSPSRSSSSSTRVRVRAGRPAGRCRRRAAANVSSESTRWNAATVRWRSRYSSMSRLTNLWRRVANRFGVDRTEAFARCGRRCSRTRARRVVRTPRRSSPTRSRRWVAVVARGWRPDGARASSSPRMASPSTLTFRRIPCARDARARGAHRGRAPRAGPHRQTPDADDGPRAARRHAEAPARAVPQRGERAGRSP